MNLKEFRAQYPQYDDMNDGELSGALHKKFYADMPEADFYDQIGYAPGTGEGGVFGRAGEAIGRDLNSMAEGWDQRESVLPPASKVLSAAGDIVGDAVDQAGTAVGGAINRFSEGPGLADYGRAIGRGGATLVEGVGQAANMAGDFLLSGPGMPTPNGEKYKLWGKTQDLADEAGVKTIPDLGREAKDYYTAGMSPEMRKVQAKNFFETDDEGNVTGLGDAWNDPHTYLTLAAESALPTMATMGAGAAGAKALMAKGMGEGAAGAVAFGGAEGVTSGITNGAQAADAILAMPFDELGKSPAFRDLLEKGHSPEDARKLISVFVGAEVSGVTTVTTGVLGAPMGAFLGKIMAGTGGDLVGSRIMASLTGALGEMTQEGSQSFVEEVVGNLAARLADPARPAMQGAVESAAKGAAAGAVTGGPIAGIAYTHPNPDGGSVPLDTAQPPVAASPAPNGTPPVAPVAEPDPTEEKQEPVAVENEPAPPEDYQPESKTGNVDSSTDATPAKTDIDTNINEVSESANVDSSEAESGESGKQASTPQPTESTGDNNATAPPHSQAIDKNGAKNMVAPTENDTVAPPEPEKVERKPVDALVDGLYRAFEVAPEAAEESPFTLLRSRGGLDPSDPLANDLRAALGMEANDRSGLFRKGGMRLDMAREALQEAYGPSVALDSIRDLVEFLADTNTRIGTTAAGAKATAKKGAQAESQHYLETYRSEIAARMEVASEEVDDQTLATAWKLDQGRVTQDEVDNWLDGLEKEPGKIGDAEIREGVRRGYPVAMIRESIKTMNQLVDVGDGVQFGKAPKKSNNQRIAEMALASPELDVAPLDFEGMTDKDARKAGIDYYHQTLRGKVIHSPAFGEDVHFTARGLAYLLSNEKRKQVLRRLRLLPQAVAVIESQASIDREDIRRVNEGKEPTHKRYALTGRFKDGSVVRVVLDEVQAEGKKFLSVFDIEDLKGDRLERKGKSGGDLPERTPRPGDHGSRVAESPSYKNNISPRPTESQARGSTGRPDAPPQKESPRLDVQDGSGVASSDPKVRAPEQKSKATDTETVHETVKKAVQEALDDRDQETQNAKREAMTAGANYVGFLDDAPAKDSAPTEKGKAEEEPLRREEVITPLMKALGARLYQGRVKGVLGFYKRGKEEVRVKRHGDLEVTAHEMAHLLADRIPEVKKSWATRLRAKELRGVSYDKNKVSEGFAEFVRLWMTQTEKAKELAPTYYDWWEQFVDQSEHKRALREAQAGMKRWYAQGALVRAKSKIGPVKEIKDALSGFGDEFRQSVSDDLHGIMEMEKSLTGEIGKVGPYVTARLTRGAHSMVEGALTIGVPVKQEDGSIQFEGTGLQAILDPVANDLEDWAMYAVGRSAKELRVQGREHLFSKDEIAAMVALETPEFKAAFDEYQAWNKGIVDFAEAMGVINPESRKLWRRAEYIPFYRNSQQAPSKRRKGVEGNWKGVHKLIGGTENLRDVIGNMIQNASMMITAAVQNEARMAVADMADKAKGGAYFMTRIAPDAKGVQIDKEQVKQFAYRSLGLDPRDVAEGMIPEEMIDAAEKMAAEFARQPDFIQFWMHGQTPRGDGVVAVMREGKAEYYQVGDPMLFRAMSSLARPGKEKLVKFLGWFKRMGQSTVTLTADFMGANLARDTLSGGIFSKHGFRPVIDSIRGMKSRIAEDDTYKAYIANGGGFSSYLVDEEAFKNHVDKFYKKQGWNPKYVLDVPSKMLYFVEKMSDAVEMSTRLGEFKRGLEKGEHPRFAAYSGREVSTDFAMRGDSQALGYLYDTVIFLKAGVSGIDRAYRGFATDPNRVEIAAKTAMLGMLSMALYAMNRGIEEYDRLEEWEKDTYWHFFIPKEGGGFHHFRLPKMWEVGAVASVAERTLETFLDGKPKEYGAHVARIFASQFKFDVVPQAIEPLLEVYMNKNRFTGRPIEDQAMQKREPWDRSSAYTNKTLTETAIASRDTPFEFSPAKMESLIKGWTNTWGIYGLALVDAAMFDDIPKMRTDDYMVVRRFYQDDPPKHTKYDTQFYDLLKEATELRRSMKHMASVGRDEIADELADKSSGSYRYLTSVNGVLNGVGRRPGINDRMRMIVQNKNMNPEEKRRSIDRLLRQKYDLMKKAVETVGEREK